MSQEQANQINRLKYLVNLALPYMKTIVALDCMEAIMREHWIKEACEQLDKEDDKQRHPAVMEMYKDVTGHPLSKE